jgi:hypothetical protein
MTTETTPTSTSTPETPPAANVAAPADAPVGAEQTADGGNSAADVAGGEQVTSIAGSAGAEADAPTDGEAAPEGAEADAAKDGEEGEQKPATLGAPEKYEIAAPEGMTFDAEAFEAVEPVLRELDLSGPAAQTIVNAYAEKVLPLLEQRSAARQQEANVAFRKQLADEARADPEIGGANFERTVDLVAQFWNAMGIKPGTGFRQLLDDSGIGNHVELLRALSRAGKAMGEGGFVPSDGAGQGGRKSDADVFYGGEK